MSTVPVGHHHLPYRAAVAALLVVMATLLALVGGGAVIAELSDTGSAPVSESPSTAQPYLQPCEETPFILQRQGSDPEPIVMEGVPGRLC